MGTDKYHIQVSHHLKVGKKNSTSHTENRYFILFFNAVWVLTSGGFRIVSDTLVIIEPNKILLLTDEFLVDIYDNVFEVQTTWWEIFTRKLKT